MPVVQEESGFTFIVNKLHLYSYFMPRLRSLYSLCCVPTVVLWCQSAHCSLLMNNRFHHSHKNLCISTVCKKKSKQEAQQLFFVFVFLFFKDFTRLCPLFLLLFCFCVTWESLSSCHWNRSKVWQKSCSRLWAGTKTEWQVEMTLKHSEQFWCHFWWGWQKWAKKQLLVSRRASSNGL